jgi:hypothetical protein
MDKYEFETVPVAELIPTTNDFNALPEISALADVLDKRMDEIDEGGEACVNNHFIETCDMNNLIRIAKLYGIPEPQNLVEDVLRNMLLSMLTHGVVPYTLRMLHVFLGSLVGGSGSYAVFIDYGHRKIQVMLGIENPQYLSSVETLIKEFIPANMEWEADVFMNRHVEFTNDRFTHGELGPHPDDTPQYYTHEHLRFNRIVHSEDFITSFMLTPSTISVANATMYTFTAQPIWSSGRQDTEGVTWELIGTYNPNTTLANGSLHVSLSESSSTIVIRVTSVEQPVSYKNFQFLVTVVQNWITCNPFSPDSRFKYAANPAGHPSSNFVGLWDSANNTAYQIPQSAALVASIQRTSNLTALRVNCIILDSASSVNTGNELTMNIEADNFSDTVTQPWESTVGTNTSLSQIIVLPELPDTSYMNFTMQMLSSTVSINKIRVAYIDSNTEITRTADYALLQISYDSSLRVFSITFQTVGISPMSNYAFFVNADFETPLELFPNIVDTCECSSDIVAVLPRATQFKYDVHAANSTNQGKSYVKYLFRQNLFTPFRQDFQSGLNVVGSSMGVQFNNSRTDAGSPNNIFNDDDNSYWEGAFSATNMKMAITFNSGYINPVGLFMKNYGDPTYGIFKTFTVKCTNTDNEVVTTSTLNVVQAGSDGYVNLSTALTAAFRRKGITKMEFAFITGTKSHQELHNGSYWTYYDIGLCSFCIAGLPFQT